MVISLKRIREIEWLPLITALLLMCNLGPFYVWGLYANPLMRYVTIVLCCIPFFFKRRKLTNKDIIVVFFWVITIITYLIVGFFNSLTIFGVAARFLTTLTVFVLYSKKDFLRSVFDYFVLIYSILVFLAFISWVLFLLGLAPDLGTLHSPMETDREFQHYPFFVVEGFLTGNIRFSGPFDEPGIIGTISALILCIKKFNLRKISSIIALISGIVSFSLFFYLVALIFYTFYSVVVKKRIWTVIVVAAGIWLLYDNTKDHIIIQELVWNRMELDSSKKDDVRITRTSAEGRAFYKKSIGSSEWFWGLPDPSNYLKMTEGSSTYMNVIMLNGAVFFFLYMLTLVLYMTKKLSKAQLFLALFIIAANMYQRPDVFGIVIFFLYACLGENAGDDYLTACSTKRHIILLPPKVYNDD